MNMVSIMKDENKCRIPIQNTIDPFYFEVLSKEKHKKFLALLIFPMINVSKGVTRGKEYQNKP